MNVLALVCILKPRWVGQAFRLRGYLTVRFLAQVLVRLRHARGRWVFLSALGVPRTTQAAGSVF